MIKTRHLPCYKTGLELVILFLCLFSASPVWAATYEVGPGQALEDLDKVPWESLAPGDRVLVHWRPEPYKSKIIITTEATEQQPLVIRGIAGPNKELPVIDGRDATTRSGLNFWNGSRGIVKIGGANHPACDPPACVPSFITIENLDIRSGRPPYRFTGRNGSTAYDKNAASIYIEVGRHITIRNCVLHDSGNGLFIGVFNGETRDILVEGNYLYDNGIENDIYEHNSYTSARGIIFQFNHYGPLRKGCLGNNLKDRSAGLVVRYNWIENGNRQLDLVDGEDSRAVPDDPAYRSTFVYGNVLVEAEGEGNSQIIHYGGDSGDTSIYRKGTLYLYNNTIVSTRNGNTTLVRLSTNDEHCDMRNNIVYATAGGSRLALLASNGVLLMSHNWLNSGWRNSHDNFNGQIVDNGENLTGNSPGFSDLSGQDFRLAPESAAIDAGGALARAAEKYPVLKQYVLHQSGEPRPARGTIDLGAFEYCPPGGCKQQEVHNEVASEAEINPENEFAAENSADAGDQQNYVDADNGIEGEHSNEQAYIDSDIIKLDGIDKISDEETDTTKRNDDKISNSGGPTGSCGCSGSMQGNGLAMENLFFVLLITLFSRRNKRKQT
ncbi:MAG: polysaccharide-degrading enzyme [Deltaproteobacteria bacterium]|nr:polysaccharide-degrading enzyme [Deltaproteobacteria bacterium]